MKDESKEVCYSIKKSMLKKIRDDINLIRNPVVVYSSNNIVMLKNIIKNMISKAEEIDNLLGKFMYPYGKGGEIKQ